MSAFLSLFDHSVDLLFRLLRPLPLFAVLGFFSVLTAVLTLLVIRWTSDQKAIRQVKDRIGAHVLAVRLFPDQLSVVLRAYLTLLGNTFLYLRHTFRPVLFLALPLFLLFVQLEAYLGRTPLVPGQDFFVSATFASPDALAGAVLRLPSGLLLTAPPVHIPPERQVDWRVKAVQPGTYDIRLVLPNSEFSKRVIVGDSLTRIVSARERGGLWQQVVNPGEPPLPRTGLVEQIQIEYPVRLFHLRTWKMEWLVPYLVLTLLGALLLKGALRTEL